MAININVNGESINYPQTGDTNWSDEATDFAVQTASAFGKIGLSSGTTVDIPGTLDVTGNTTLDANLSVGGNATITGNLTANGNSNLGNASGDTIVVTGILNVDSGVLYVDPTNNRVGINDTTPSVELDVNGSVAISGNETVGGNLRVIGNLSVDGNTTLGNTSGDSLTINSNGVSIPNGLNFDSNTLVINAANNRVGIGVASPGVPLDIQADSVAFSMDIRGRSADNIGLIRFLNNAGSARYRMGLWSNDSLCIQNSNGGESLSIAQNGQLSAVVPGGSTLYPGYLCRAWVNFNGTGTVAIRASGNVSSITDNNTGDYTVNFTTAMPDANYSSISCVQTWVSSTSAQTTTSFKIITFNSTTGTNYDDINVKVGVFR